MPNIALCDYFTKLPCAKIFFLFSMPKNKIKILKINHLVLDLRVRAIPFKYMGGRGNPKYQKLYLFW